MFSHYGTKGVVISKKDQGESDRVLITYTEQFGKLKIFGKSIRKESSKLRSGSEPFALLELEFVEGRWRKTLTDVRVIDSYPKTNSDLERIALAGMIADDLDGLIGGEEKDPKVWELVQSSFNLIEAGKGLFAYHRFFWNLLSILGYGPEIYHCSQCRGGLDPSELLFSPEDGGLVCASCRPKDSAFSVNERTIKVIRVLLRDDGLFEKLRLNSVDEGLLWDASRRYFSVIQ